MTERTEQLEGKQNVLRPVVAVLTAGRDQPYAFGLATALVDRGLTMDLITGDELDLPFLRNKPGMRLLNFRGDQRPEVGLISRISRVGLYYYKLLRYALTSPAPIFHILWNNKFEYFDRTVVMLYYRSMRKRIVLTLHNVNAGRRDRNDSRLNRATLRIQYQLAHHLFVHSENTRDELCEEFGVRQSKVTVIPFGINNAAPQTDLTAKEAKRRLGLRADDKAILFFGRITPYKGLEYLIAAFRQALTCVTKLRLVIAGSPDQCEDYWQAIRKDIQNEVQRGKILLRAEFIPDEETEVYFKAADALVLPYRDVYQSGVLFLAQSFGLPVLAADVGSLKDDIQHGTNGYLFRPEDSRGLAVVIDQYFANELYANLDSLRPAIRARAAALHSWEVVSQMTMSVYAGLLHVQVANGAHESSDMNLPEGAKTPVSVSASSSRLAD